MAFNLLLWPGPGLASQHILSFASRALDARVGFSTSYEAYFVRSLFSQSASMTQHETMADRASAVAHIRISPVKFVGYENEGTAFAAVATDFLDRHVQGVKFTWESSNADKLEIDEAGRARFLKPGLARITCRAGMVQATAPVLIRPNHRPRQTDAEWRADQAGLDVDGNIVGATTGSPDIVSALSSLLDKLAPTAFAQTAPDSWADDFGYDQLWSEPRNLVGSPRSGVVEPMPLGSVFPEGSNFKWAAPIISLGGRGLAANLTLYYNSRVWSRRDTRMAFDAITGWPAPGFSLGFGRMVVYGLDYLRYMWVEPDGTRHLLGTSTSYYGSGPFEATDGSHIVYSGNAASGGTVNYPDGTSVIITVVNNLLLPTAITDRNGNYIQIAYKPDCVLIGSEMYCGLFAPMAIDYVIDTMGRIIHFQYDSNYRLSSISAPGFGGTTQNPVTQTLVQFDYQSVSPSYNFSGLTLERYPGSSLALGHIYFPATGTGYLPTYSQYGMIYNVSIRRQMSASTWPPGSPPVISNGVESAAVSFNYPTSGALTDAPTFTQRTETAVNSPTGVYTYSRADYSTSVAFAVARPDGSTLYMTRIKDASTVGDGRMQYREILSGGHSYGYIWLAYVNDGGGSPQVQSAFSADDLGQQSLTNFDYDAYGNITNKREYGYQVSGAWQVRRRTHLTYKTDAGYATIYGSLRGLVTEADVYDALGNTNDADDVLIAKTTYAYDNYVAMGGMEDYGGTANPPGHLSPYSASYTLRGNVTGTTQWTDLAAGTTIQHLAKYDLFGSVVKAQVSCCQEKDLTNTLNTYWSQPESEMSGDPNGVHQTTSTDYDFNTSLPRSATDAGGLISNFGYDAARNPNSVALPTGASANTGYDYGNLSSSSSVYYDDGGVTKTLTSTAQYDGWGRVIQAVDRNNGQVNTSYDAIGRVTSRTNPFTAGGTPGPATTFLYDALGRGTITTLPGGNTVQNAYSGATVTVTDQVNRKIQRISDGLGRLVTVNEQDATGALTQATAYSYDYLDKLTGVNQGGQLRSYKYDAMSRLLYERIPEQSATINDGTGTMWSCQYTYTEFSEVATRTDARGVVKNYTYDALHQVSSISYNTGSASGVAATAPISFVYTTSGAISSVWVNYIPLETYSFDSNDRVSSVTSTIDSKSYVTRYEYNAANQMTQLTYPSGSQVNLSYDSRGRLNSLADQWLLPYANGMTYNAEARQTGLTFGNGVVETYGYDPNRSQLVSQTASKSGTSLMNLTYSYQASAGQSGANTTAGNTHQLISLSGTINGTNESASYTYDLQRRLVTSSQTTTGVSVQRRFAYDRWGSRTGAWDATSGGNQIQSVALQQSGGAPTNRLTSVTTSGLTANYTYDAAGNVTNDGVHSYTYDAENRLVSVDGGVTAQYSYDHQSQRVKKVSGGATTHYIWDGGQVLAEHDGTAAGPWTTKVEYVYARSGLIATRQYTVGQQQSTALRYYLSDVWSTRLVLDSNGNVIGRQAHLPFGEEFAESGTQEKHHFASYEAESASGSDYAVNRQYSQTTGRFQSADPYQAGDYQVNPQSWNRYSYVENDPIHNADPSGLFAGVPRVGMPDPCNGSPPPDPVDGPPGCSIGFRTEGPPIGGYNNDGSQMTPNFNPNSQPLGPGVSGPYFFFYFEILVTTFGSNPTDWTFQQFVAYSEVDTYRTGKNLPPLTETHSQPEHDDPWPDTNQRWIGSVFIWFDAPALGYPPFFNTTPYDVIDVVATWTLRFRAEDRGTSCQRTATLKIHWIRKQNLVRISFR